MAGEDARDAIGDCVAYGDEDHRSVPVVALAFGLAGCGSDGPDLKPWVDAFVKTGFESDSGFKPTTARKRCLAQAEIEIIGVDTLKKAGLTPAKIAAKKDPLKKLEESMTPAKAEKFADLIVSGKCLAFGEVIAVSLERTITDKTKARCFGDAVVRLAEFRTYLIAQATGAKNPVNPLSDKTVARRIAVECKIDPAGIGL